MSWCPRHPAFAVATICTLFADGGVGHCHQHIDAVRGFGYQAVGLIELLTVLLIAVYIGRGPALVAAAASAISWNYLFIPPRFTFHISQVQDVILFVLYFVIAIFAGNLTARIRTAGTAGALQRRTQHGAL
jgi:K+-sensing histidine kinase KdpD